jgi:NADH:ubiquinone oxidoreductase subunit 6 (subunit J)
MGESLVLVAYLLLALSVLAGAAIAVRAANLIHAALALIAASSCLAVLLFMLQAPYAGSVTLSIGAGLLGVLFIIAISLTEPMGGGPRVE